MSTEKIPRSSRSAVRFQAALERLMDPRYDERARLRELARALADYQLLQRDIQACRHHLAELQHVSAVNLQGQPDETLPAVFAMRKQRRQDREQARTAAIEWLIQRYAGIWIALHLRLNVPRELCRQAIGRALDSALDTPWQDASAALAHAPEAVSNLYPPLLALCCGDMGGLLAQYQERRERVIAGDLPPAASIIALEIRPGSARELKKQLEELTDLLMQWARQNLPKAAVPGKKNSRGDDITYAQHVAFANVWHEWEPLRGRRKTAAEFILAVQLGDVDVSAVWPIASTGKLPSDRRIRGMVRDAKWLNPEKDIAPTLAQFLAAGS